MCSALDTVLNTEVLTLQPRVIQEVLVRLPQLPRLGVPVHSSQRYLPPSPYHLEMTIQRIIGVTNILTTIHERTQLPSWKHFVVQSSTLTLPLFAYR